MTVFELISLGFYNLKLINVIENFITEVFQSEVIILPQTQVPSDYKNIYRGQYDGFKLLRWSSNLKTVESSILVGLADVDAYVLGLNFIFGIADPKSRVALVFLERLKEAEGLQGVKFITRVKKEVLHEVGHVLGLRHCSNKKCVMVFSNSIYDTDFKEFKYCGSCYGFLIHSGFSVNPKYSLGEVIS